MKIRMPDGAIVKIQDGLSQDQIGEIVDDYSKRAGIAPPAQQPQSAPKPAPVTNYIQAQMAPTWAVANSRELLPNASAAQDKGNRTGILTGGVADLLSAPGRFIDSAIAGGGLQNVKKNMSDVTTDRGFIRNMVRSPETPVGLIPIGGAGASLGSMALKSALVGGAAGTVGEMGNYAQTGNFSPASVLASSALGAAVPVVFDMAGHALSKLPSIAKVGSDIAEQAATHNAFAGKTGNINQALTAFNKDPKAILEAAGKEKEIGQAIQNAIYKLQGGETENPIINEAISNMPRIDLKNTIKAIKKAMEPEGESQLEPWQDQINTTLKGLIKRLENKGGSSTNVDKSGYLLTPTEVPTANKSLSAAEFLDKRRAIDKGIDWQNLLKDAAGALDQKLSDIRKVMATDLENTAVSSGNPDYVIAIKDYHNKLKTAEDLLGSTGGRYLKENPEMFIKRLGDENKNITRENLKKLDDLIGSDFSNQARNSIYSRWLGIGEGDTKLGFMPQHKTGMGVLDPRNIIGNPTTAAAINKFNTNNMPNLVNQLAAKGDATAAVLNNPKLSKAVQMAIYNLLGAQ